MKLSDIHQELTERPGGFGSVMKAKVKKQLSPFMKQRQQAASDDERLIKVAREMKKSLQGWMAKAFRSTGGAKAEITMAQFLGWVKKAQPKYANGIESYARGDRDYAEHFSQAIDSKGKQTSTATDPKVKVRSNKPHQAAGDGDNLELEKDPVPKGQLSPEDQAGLDKINRDAEEESAEFDRKEKEQEKQDLKASKGEDKEPKVDTSASIYEARLKALLEADEDVEDGADIDSGEDVGTNRSKTLKDNQIDTLITMGIEKQIELDGGESIIDDPSELSSQGVAVQSGSNAESDDFLGEYQDELEDVLAKVKAGGKDIDKRNQQSANNMLNSL